jgi:predicted nucleotidyltransferase
MKKTNIRKALRTFSNEMKLRYGNKAEMFLFGSAARGDYSPESDIDILVVYNDNVNNSLEEDIFDIAYEAGLEHNVVFGIIVYARDLWLSARGADMPLFENVARDGIRL